MGLSSTGADALFEIISLCEQALTELAPESNGLQGGLGADKPRSLRRRGSTNMARHLSLIPGGLSVTTRMPTAR